MSDNLSQGVVDSCIFIQVIKNALVCIPLSFHSFNPVQSLILNQKHSNFSNYCIPNWIYRAKQREKFSKQIWEKNEKMSDNILVYIQVSTTPCLHKTYMCHVGCLLVGRWGWSHSISCRILDSGPCIFHKKNVLENYNNYLANFIISISNASWKRCF